MASTSPGIPLPTSTKMAAAMAMITALRPQRRLVRSSRCRPEITEAKRKGEQI